MVNGVIVIGCGQTDGLDFQRTVVMNSSDGNIIAALPPRGTLIRSTGAVIERPFYL